MPWLRPDSCCSTARSRCRIAADDALLSDQDCGLAGGIEMEVGISAARQSGPDIGIIGEDAVAILDGQRFGAGGADRAVDDQIGTRAVQADRRQARPGDGRPLLNDCLGVRGDGEGLIVAGAGGLRRRTGSERGDDTSASEQRLFGRAILQIHISPL